MTIYTTSPGCRNLDVKHKVCYCNKGLKNLIIAKNTQLNQSCQSSVLNAKLLAGVWWDLKFIDQWAAKIEMIDAQKI